MVCHPETEKLKILIVGFGSSGQRYARVLKKISSDFRLMVFRGKHRMGLIHSSLLKISRDVDPVLFYNLEELSENELSMHKYELVIICTPASSHLYYSKLFYDKSNKLLVEKPLCISQDEIKQFAQIYSELKGNLLVGYQHFHNPIFNKVSEEYSIMQLPRHIQLEFLEPLADMNPFRDMSTHHLSSPKGGGALLALSHELDFLFRLEPRLTRGLLTSETLHLSHSDNFDSCKLRVRLALEKECLLDVNLSYAPGPNKRGGHISDGYSEILWDLKQKIMVKNRSGLREVLKFEFSSDDLIEQLLTKYIGNEMSKEDLEERFSRAKYIVELAHQ